MRGLGYTHPEWGHGHWHGEHAVGSEEHKVEELDNVEPWNIHIQQVMRARWGDRVGLGVLEQLAFGEHTPSGLTGILDGYRPGGLTNRRAQTGADDVRAVDGHDVAVGIGRGERVVDAAASIDVADVDAGSAHAACVASRSSTIRSNGASPGVGRRRARARGACRRAARAPQRASLRSTSRIPMPSTTAPSGRGRSPSAPRVRSTPAVARPRKEWSHTKRTGVM